ncbi:MAG: amidohydrolase [Sphingobacteriales bacterium SCN 48-20]|uniref:amidohydrolase family protein n=1 Tax=Terrimonas ferruginea TaxID=249 RepID=UPI00086D3717|nr:amidohydrolase family protein [Terrimonas ferruginea]MBN8783166.1 amidohydrolase family protein [Terrimonas ferruginea]ODT92652.1 MAG: amidohydrolase [Sphingobacteriales bacterium SCN 48-20]OJW39792.1 MAG: amidohydrolase [Sphingobacteriales bacterium 48-107]
MKKNITAIIALLLAGGVASAQDDVYPAPEYKGLSFITNATIHVGNGQVINNGTIKINNGKIEQVGTNIPIPVDDVRVYNAAGKQVYPGMILPDTDLGLKEISSGVRGSNDFRELGDWNTSVRSIVAYNTDSRIINTLKANGILLASVSPQGGLLTGTSSVVQLDAWNWEDAAYQLDGALHLNFPSLLQRRGRFGGGGMQGQNDPIKEALARVEAVKQFFREAKAYLAEKTHAETNLRFESLRPLFEKKQKLFVHAGIVKEMLVAIDFAKEFGVDVVIVGGSESYQIADLLRENNIAVILSPMHNLPTLEDDDVDQPYKTPAILQKAGVLFAINDDHGESRYRNLPFNAGTAAAYGLTKEEALQSVTLNPAKILGIADRTGTLEVGKDANIVISAGDLLDMRTSLVTDVFIQGRKVSLENKQTQLYERYKKKYGIN